MVKKKRGILALLLSLAMVVGFTACSGNSARGSSGSGGDPKEMSSGPAAMGRYVETEEALPEGVSLTLFMTQQPDGSLRLLGDGGGQGVGPWSILSSADGGRAWTNVDYPWLNELTGSQPVSATLTADGMYIIYEVAGTEGAETEYIFAYGDATGLAPVPFELVDEGESTLMNITLYAAGNGDLLAYDNGRGEISQIDTVSWKVKNTFPATANNTIAPGVAVYGNNLAVHNADKTIALYDLDSGASGDEISVNGETGETHGSQKTALVSATLDGAAWLYSNDTGVYRVPMGTTLSERLIDGGLSSLSIPSLIFYNVYNVADDEYLALAINPMAVTSHLFRYTYNPDIPAEPSQAIKVYSLHDNKTVRQASSGFQTKNPDVRVEYQAGLDGGGSVTAADAMRTLSTELLAGKGPDVLVLDDMDVDGYIQRGILADISDALAGTDTLANITGTFQRDGALFAVPARFSIPVLVGDGVNGTVKDLKSLNDWLATQYTYDIGVRRDDVMTRFYAACSYRWFTADGKLDEAAFRADLEELGRLTGEIGALDEVQTYDSMLMDTMLWYGGGISASYGAIGGFVDITLFDMAIKNRPTGSYTPFPSDEGGVYVPGSILGVNVAAASPDLAKEFVKYVLSEDAQDSELGDGFPVNSAAFEALSKAPEGLEENGRAAMPVKNAQTGETVDISLAIQWPSDAFMNEFKTMLRGLTVPVKTNAVIREMIIDETSGYLSGNGSLDDVVRSLTQKMELYLSEQQ